MKEPIKKEYTELESPFPDPKKPYTVKKPKNKRGLFEDQEFVEYDEIRKKQPESERYKPKDYDDGFPLKMFSNDYKEKPERPMKPPEDVLFGNRSKFRPNITAE